jgi:general secretion pathway protein C
VVLSRNGRLETLLLDKNRPSKSTAPAVTDDEESSDDDEDANATGLARIRNEILSDPGKAQEYIRVQPVNTNGTTKGYRVYPGRNRDLFNEAGLRPGDLVTSINGVDLTDTARSMQLLADLAQVEDLTVVVDRGGQSQSIHVSLGQ